MKKLVTISLLAVCAYASIDAKSSSWPSRQEQERLLLNEITKCLKLPNLTRSAELSSLTYDQQVDYLCLMLDLIMDTNCKITQSVMAEAFKRYCTEIKTRHPKLYEHFCKTPTGFWNVTGFMQKYNGMSDSEIPAKAARKRVVDRKAFDKKHSGYWAQYKVMKKVAKKFK